MYCRRMAHNGVLHEFITTTPFLLMALDHCDNIRAMARTVRLRTQRDAEFLDLLSVAFRCTQKRKRGETDEEDPQTVGSIPHRLSRHMQDRQIFQTFCDRNIVGTAARPLPMAWGDDSTRLHSEVFLCVPREVVYYVGEAMCGVS